METEIKKVLQQVRPLLAMHRGDVEFVDYKDGVVRVKLLGTCHGCPLASLTLKAGIEDMLKSNIHGIERVEAV
ncbi:NifU family protein [Patescibacteria group bacterium]|nr:NifU family protein [Patescibacteria group bacterium]